jgi:hypothetical protein
MNIQNSIQSVSALEFGQIQVVIAKTVLDDNVAVAETTAVYQILPGDRFDDQEQRVQDVCRAVHTPDVIKEFKSQLEYRTGAERQKIKISRMTGLKKGI